MLKHTMISRYVIRTLLFMLAASTAVAQQYIPLRIVSPNGGERLRAGTTATIQWGGVLRGGEDGDSVRLEFSIDGGATWETIVENVIDSSYHWLVPFSASSRCRIRVTQTGGYRGYGHMERVLATDTIAERPGIHLSRDGSLLLQERYRRIDVIRALTGELVRTIRRDSGFSTWGALSPDGKRMAVGVSDKANLHAEVIDVATGSTVFQLRATGNSSVPQGIANEMQSLWYSPDGATILMATKFSLSRWNAATGVLIDSVLQVQVGLLGYSADGRSLFATGGRALIAVRDPVTLLPTRSVPTGEDFLAFSDDGAKILSRTMAWPYDTLYITDVAAGVRLPFKTWSNYRGYAFGAFARDGRRILYGHMNDVNLAIFDTVTYRDVARLGPFVDSTGYILYHPDGAHVIVQVWPSYDVQLWSADRADTSDADFTIENARPVLPTTSFPGVKVGTQADTVLTAYVRNTGGSPMTVGGVSLVLGDVGDFAVLDSGGFTLAPGEARDVRVRFRPTAKGERSAWLEVRAAGDTIVGLVAGMGLQGMLRRVPEEVDFGELVPNQSRELWTETVKNVGNAPLRIDSLYTEGQHRGTYTIVGGPSVPFVLQPGETHALTVRCAPDQTGLLLGDRLAYEDEYGVVEIVRLRCHVLNQSGVDESSVIAGRSGLVRSMAPNPASEELHIALSARPGREAGVDIVDVTGRLVLHRVIGTDGSTEELVLDVRELPAGVYIARVTVGTERDVRRIVIHR